uniref:Uncharacterized protein n=1 Tax=Anguilla anguilla TaxID=7936 RepID=A0A0E9QYJ1_ANGAN
MYVHIYLYVRVCVYTCIIYYTHTHSYIPSENLICINDPVPSSADGFMETCSVCSH